MLVELTGIIQKLQPHSLRVKPVTRNRKVSGSTHFGCVQKKCPPRIGSRGVRFCLLQGPWSQSQREGERGEGRENGKKGEGKGRAESGREEKKNFWVGQTPHFTKLLSVFSRPPRRLKS